MAPRIFVASSVLLFFLSLADAQLPTEFKGHTGFVHHLAFSA